MTTKKEIREFLKQSNFIEDERRGLAVEDAIASFDYALTFKGEWNVNFILKVHKLLMKRVNPRIAGKLRDCDVYIGGHRKRFVSEALLKEDLKNWIKSLGKSAYFQTDVEVALQGEHIAFENIHPFEDGNGRTGRILWQVQRLKLGLPIRIIHEGSEQMEYYSWFERRVGDEV